MLGLGLFQIKLNFLSRSVKVELGPLPLQCRGCVAPGKWKRCVSRIGLFFQVWPHGPITLDSWVQRTRGLYCFQSKPVLRPSWQVCVVEMTGCPLQSHTSLHWWGLIAGVAAWWPPRHLPEAPGPFLPVSPGRNKCPFPAELVQKQVFTHFLFFHP